ncbi:MAG TPA: lytic transglycosylase domain-containing protein [Solirubrobacteraceae bacterium]|nr:lytic transglycosylase domain-containing protein [Solirubrobacteraceae bacterium]
MINTSRRLLTLFALAAIAVAVIAALPLIRRAINHFTLPLEYAAIIRQQADEKHLDPALVAAVIYAETRFRPRVSATGALGLMQIEPATARFLAHRSGGTRFAVRDLATPQVNIAYGSYYLRYLLNEYDNNKVLALAAYNGGETNVDAWVSTARRSGRRFTINDIPLGQTRAYVQEVLSKQRDYRSTYPQQLGYG